MATYGKMVLLVHLPWKDVVDLILNLVALTLGVGWMTLLSIVGRKKMIFHPIYLVEGTCVHFQ